MAVSTRMDGTSTAGPVKPRVGDACALSAEMIDPGSQCSQSGQGDAEASPLQDGTHLLFAQEVPGELQDAQRDEQADGLQAQLGVLPNARLAGGGYGPAYPEVGYEQPGEPGQ
jgi:hypothetical protein